MRRLEYLKKIEDNISKQLLLKLILKYVYIYIMLTPSLKF